MLKNHLLVALRVFWRQRIYTALNVIGLAVALALSQLVYLYVYHEWTYDAFHPHADRLYRLVESGRHPWTGDEYQSAQMPPGLATDLCRQYPAVVEACTIRPEWSGTTQVRADRDPFEVRLFYAGPAFLRILSFPLMAGDPRTALAAPQGVILGQPTATRLFGKEPALERTVTIRTAGFQGEWRTFTVTGVAREVPTNSSIQFDLLLPEAAGWPGGVSPAEPGNLHSGYGEVFLQLAPKVRPAELEPLLNEYRRAHDPDRSVGPAPRWWLQPVTAMHLEPRVTGPVVQPGNPLYPRILAAMALCVLLLACVNYANLAMGTSAGRLLEATVRQVSGARPWQLLTQHWVESFLLVAVAGVLGLTLAESVLPLFNSLTRKSLSFALLGEGPGLAGMLGLLLLVGLVAGSYPAISLSGLRPAEVLSSRVRVGGTNWLTRSLVTIQLIVSVLLAFGAVVMSTQLRHLRTADLGFRTEGIVVVHTGGAARFDTPGEWRGKTGRLEIYARRLLAHPQIRAVSCSDLYNGLAYREPLVLPGGERVNVFRLNVGIGFLGMHGVSLLEGRDFVEGRDDGDQTIRPMIVNQSMARLLGPGSPLGRELAFDQLYYEDDQGRIQRCRQPIIGVVEDFHFQSLHHPVEPLALSLTAPWLPSPGGGGPALGVSLAEPDSASPLAYMERLWRELFPDAPFEYSLLADDLARQYSQEERWGSLMAWTAASGVVIACLGALGLTALAVAGRTREIGIRKVLGASRIAVTALVCRELVILSLAAVLLAVPLGHLIMRHWLDHFAYRIPLGPALYLTSGGAVCLAVWLVAGALAVKAAGTDPVKALRQE